MRLLDRYIARQYLINVIVLFVLLFGFVVTIDVSLNIDRFSRAATSIAEEAGDASKGRVWLLTAFVIADLWWPRLLQLFNFLLGLVMTGAMGFTVSQLVRHREVVAALAGGVSLHRLAAPILAIAVALTGLQAINQEFVLPQIAPLLTRDQGKAGRHELGVATVPLTPDQLGRVWFADRFDADSGVMTGVLVWERDERGLATRRITAERAIWNDGGWDLEEGIAESRTDAATEPDPIARLDTNLDPTELRLRRYSGYGQNLSWRRIGQMIRVLDTIETDPVKHRESTERLERIRWGRVGAAAANLLGLTIAIPFFLTRLPTNLLTRSLKCAPLAILTLMGGVIGSSVPVPGVPAAIGVFVPAVIMLPIAAAMLTSLRT